MQFVTLIFVDHNSNSKELVKPSNALLPIFLSLTKLAVTASITNRSWPTSQSSRCINHYNISFIFFNHSSNKSSSHIKCRQDLEKLSKKNRMFIKIQGVDKASCISLSVVSSKKSHLPAPALLMRISMAPVDKHELRGLIVNETVFFGDGRD